MRVEDFQPIPLDEATAPIVGAFQCSACPPFTDELVAYLRNKALAEAAQNVSRTWLWCDDQRRVGAYATVTAISVPARSGGLGAAIGVTKPFVPGLMIDQIAVADYVRASKLHLGHAIFQWTRREVVLANRRSAARIIRLDVQVGNWRAYRVYRNSWHLNALPGMVLHGQLVELNGRPAPLPDPSLTEPPPHLHPETLIKLWHDVYAAV